MVDFIFQPQNGYRVGDLLISELQNETWDQFRAVIAFVKRSGVKHIQKHLSAFSSRGHVEIVVGIDQGGTTVEGLQMLFDAMGDRGKLFVFHNRNNSTFHPKIYNFRNQQASMAIIGSNNLTEGGLYTNYEASLVVNLDLGQENDQISDQRILGAFEVWTDIKSGLVQILTLELLQKLAETGYIPTEKQARRSKPKTEKKSSDTAEENVNIDRFFSFQSVLKAPAVTIDGRYIRPDEDADYDDETVIEKPKIQQEQLPEVANQVEDENNQNILVKYVPKAGNRTSQVHFTLDNMHSFFHLEVSQPIQLRQHQPGQPANDIEHRQLVLSEANKNAKIEVGGARILVNNYPIAGGKPILIFKKVEGNLYDYMLLLPGDNGYAQISAYLDSLPTKRSLASDTMAIGKLKNIWSGYPS